MTNTNAQGRQQRRPATQNHLRGAALEDMLRWQHNVYRSQGIAYIWQNGVKSIHRKGQIVQLPSMPDFGGILTGLHGRYVSFDAKLCASAYYHHPSDRLHQLRTLYDIQEAGGIAFLLISIELEKFYLIWPNTNWRDERPMSLRLDKIQPNQGIEFDRGGGHNLPNWLSSIHMIYGEAGL